MSFASFDWEWLNHLLCDLGILKIKYHTFKLSKLSPLNLV